MSQNFIWVFIRPVAEYLSILLRVLPLMYLATPFLGDISKYLLLPIFGDDEVLFRPTFFSVLMCALLQLISLKWFDALNKVIWFRSRERCSRSIYRAYQYVFLVFGLFNLVIAILIYKSYTFLSLDWFAYRDYLFWELLALLCFAPCVFIYKTRRKDAA